jgi:hypothetical protein
LRNVLHRVASGRILCVPIALPLSFFCKAHRRTLPRARAHAVGFSRPKAEALCYFFAQIACCLFLTWKTIVRTCMRAPLFFSQHGSPLSSLPPSSLSVETAGHTNISENESRLPLVHLCLFSPPLPSTHKYCVTALPFSLMKF